MQLKFKISVWMFYEKHNDIPHTATYVTYAEIPLCPINPIGRKGDLMAGFLTYGLWLNITFLSFLSGIFDTSSPITVAGTVTDMAVFPIIP